MKADSDLMKETMMGTMKLKRAMKATIKDDGAALDSTMQQALQKGYVDIPSFVFKDRTLSVLEVMTEYLHDTKKMRFCDIAAMLNRDERTVWTVYRRAKLKRKGLIRNVTRGNE